MSGGTMSTILEATAMLAFLLTFALWAAVLSGAI